MKKISGILPPIQSEKLKHFFDSIKLSEIEKQIAHQILKEVKERLGFLVNVGLGLSDPGTLGRYIIRW